MPSSGLAKGGAGHCRERRINESGIEQTVVAFGVTLKMPTSQQGTAAWCPPLKAGASLRRNSGVFEETPHASGLAAGFFFSGRWNQFAATRIALAWKIGTPAFRKRH